MSAIEKAAWRFGIIIGSTRPRCNGKAIATWIHRFVQTDPRLSGEYTLLDLAEWNLPLLDEPGVPMKDPPTHTHTKAWQQRIQSLDGFVFVTPQYNWGYPAALKNALDYLFREWNDKPAAIITYGGRGGGKAAAQLQQVLQGLRMKIVPEMPGITLREQHILHGLTPEQAEKDFAGYSTDILATVAAFEQSLKNREQAP